MLGGSLMMAACSGPGADQGGASPTPGTPGSPAGEVAPSVSPDLDDELRVSTAEWSTDFSKHEVPLAEIISGGPG